MPLLRPDELVLLIKHRYDKRHSIQVALGLTTKLKSLRIHMNRDRNRLRLIRLLGDATRQINRQLRDIDFRQQLLLNLIVLHTLRRIITTRSSRSPNRRIALRRKIPAARLNVEPLALAGQRNLQRVITTIRLQLRW